MKKIILLAISILSVSQAWAQHCESGDGRVQVRFEEQGSNALVSVTETAFHNYGKSGSFAVKGQEGIKLLVEKAHVGDLLSNPREAEDVLAKALFSLNAFAGEEDMVHAYASEYIAELVCHTDEQP